MSDYDSEFVYMWSIEQHEDGSWHLMSYEMDEDMDMHDQHYIPSLEDGIAICEMSGKPYSIHHYSPESGD